MHKMLAIKSVVRWLLVLGCSVAITAGAFAQDAAPAYVLAVGDVIRINVLDEKDLNQERVAITDNGTFPFPFIGEVKAAGRTTTQIQQAITAGLKPDYLVDPIITVTIIEYRPYFLDGEVSKPGSYPYSPELTLRQAITIAGGLTERGSEKKITVVPAGKSQDSKGGKPKDAIPVPMDYLVKPGDTIHVDQSFF